MTMFTVTKAFYYHNTEYFLSLDSAKHPAAGGWEQEETNKT